MHFALVLSGHSFRVGYQMQRFVHESAHPQIEASLTHMQFKRQLENKGHTVDLYGRTYENVFTNLLSSVYPEHRSMDTVPEQYYRYQGDMLLSAISRVPLDSYDFVIRFRFDMFLKDPVELANRIHEAIMAHGPNHVLFGCKMYCHTEEDPTVETYPEYIANVQKANPQGVPRINDNFYVIPKKHFCFLGKECIGFSNNHNFLIRMVAYSVIHGHEFDFVEDVRYLYDEYSDSDPFKLRNSVYRLVCRPEGAEGPFGTTVDNTVY